ncbi:hypothetical protein B0O99DRAFT_620930 [Bisporella sp. PMI_857]|nr:hypothetical protein B0O99DRAFT_620930 [Bisporella sp. PMI_857]
MGDLSGRLHHSRRSLHPLIKGNTPEAALHSSSAAPPPMSTVLVGNMYSLKRLHVGNLSSTTNERDLREEFERYGGRYC